MNSHSSTDAAASSAHAATDTVDEASQSPKAFRRATMIVNPYSSGMTARRERTIVRVLSEQLDLEVRRTERGGHATEIAAEATENGTDLIIACGGDGTGNEVVNGMGLDTDTATTRPAFALVPAGGTNVFCRSLGLPNHPVRAIEQLAQTIATGKMRTVNLAKIDERVFLFSAGVGLDAAVVRQIELKRRGRRPSDLAHANAAFGAMAYEKFSLKERMTIQIMSEDGAVTEELRAALAVICNTTPMTYMGRVPLTFLPDASLDKGVDLAAPKKLNASMALRLVAEALGKGQKRRNYVKAEKVQRRTDLPAFAIHCDEPQPCQVDGEFIGERTDIKVRSLRSCVRFVI
jgi:diacylglycerol kinase family enzyme